MIANQIHGNCILKNLRQSIIHTLLNQIYFVFLSKTKRMPRGHITIIHNQKKGNYVNNRILEKKSERYGSCSRPY